MGDVQVKGFVFAKYLEEAQLRLDQETFKKMEDNLGIELKDVKHAYFRDFPAELQIAVERAYAEMVRKERYEDAAYDMGRINFESFQKSAIGRTTLILVGKEPIKIIKATLRLISTVTKGLKVEVKEVGDKEYSIHFFNSPYLAQGWRGTLDAAIEQGGGKPDTRIVNHGRNNYELLVTWT